MFCSVYTPTHNPRWLPEVYRSLCAQQYSKWEWVILKNGANSFELPADLLADPRVKVYESISTGIGRLKREAVERCSGDLFVELDHDDKLASNCLSELVTAAQKEPNGFYFSDFASVFPNGAPEVFSSSYGWKQYESSIDGQPFLCQSSFPVTPRSLCEIWYAPNHVRCWSRSAYVATGGYDETLPVGDDHDLICRSYLARVPFTHIAKPLYIYRRIVSPKDSNSFVRESDKIKEINLRNMNKYLYSLIEEWCRRHSFPKYDFGGAHNSPNGYTTVDLHDADICCDLSKPFQFASNSVGVIRAYDFIEHLPANSLPQFMNEVYRVLVPGGFFISATPSSDGRGAFQDPTHSTFVNPNSFWYYTDRDFSKYVPAITCRFQNVRLWSECPSEWHKQHLIPYVYADLCAIKGFEHVGAISI